ncbi:MAG: protein kinase [Polaromonas sp.]|nr:protein kinase [Polaromonas sp.]
MHTLDQLRSGALAGIRRLDLSCGLTELPTEVFALADTLEVLNLSGNRLTGLPHDLPRLHRLKVVFASDNPFTHLPEVLGDCPSLHMVGFKACRITHVPEAALPPNLRWLTLTDNGISMLPRILGERSLLQKLMLSGNRLTHLPDSLAQAQRLELIRLSANRLAQLPGWLTELPSLAWLALSGNPLGWPQTRPEAPLPRVPWAHLRLEGLLGEGASGHIHRAHPVHATPLGVDGPLALKLFKGAVTSDGLPEHELAACRAAGQHPALCTPSAELADHPQGLAGLLLPLMASSHINLAGPPSLDSCTRDVYAPDLRLSAPTALHLARQMAGAVAHLHAQGVMHGDFYAHNILWHPASGQATLSDFGAATLLPTHAPALARALQALEVRAFGLWLQELLGLADAAPPGAYAAALAPLADACAGPDPTARPTMREVAEALAA